MKMALCIENSPPNQSICCCYLVILLSSSLLLSSFHSLVLTDLELCGNGVWNSPEGCDGVPNCNNLQCKYYYILSRPPMSILPLVDTDLIIRRPM